MVSVSPPCQRTCRLMTLGARPLETVMSRTSRRRMRLRSLDVVVAAAHSRGKSCANLHLAKFFDRVHHQRLLARIAERVKDPRIVALVRLMLKAAVIMPDGTKIAVQEGTPQGGPLSPLLSNIVLNELDGELARRGLRFVRYADDCNIFV